MSPGWSPEPHLPQVADAHDVRGSQRRRLGQATPFASFWFLASKKARKPESKERIDHFHRHAISAYGRGFSGKGQVFRNVSFVHSNYPENWT